MPVKLVAGERYVECPIDEATHVTMNIPGPTEVLTLPVIQSGTRDGTGCWTWNGSVDAPTLRPSVFTTAHNYRAHSWINDGQAQFLSDSTHHAGETLDLLEVKP